MRVLIVGGAGFVGGRLALHLKERGHDVVVMDNLVRRGSELNLPEFRKRGIDFHHGDVRSPEDFVQLPRDVDVICDTSAQPTAVDGYRNPVFDITNNTVGLVNTLEFARKNDAGLIFWSTNKVYSGNEVNKFPRAETDARWTWDKATFHKAFATPYPGFDPEHGIAESLTIDGGEHSIYGLSKVMADLACQEYHDAFGVNAVVNRFSCLAGEGQFGKTEQGWVAWFALAHEFDLPISFYGWKGKQVRDVLFIPDICRLVEMQMERMDEIGGEVFNVGGGPKNTLSLVEAVAHLAKVYGKSVPVTVEDEPRKSDQCIYVSDIRKAERVLGWRPEVTIEKGYERLVSWIGENEERLRWLYA